MQTCQKSILWAILVTLISASVIFFQFNQIPADLTRDEIEFVQLAVQLGEQSYTPYSEHATGHATPYFYVLLASFKLFGLNQFALRFPAALFGILTSIALFGVFKLVFTSGTLSVAIPGKKRPLEIDTALLLTLIFITMRWFFGFARFSFEATFVLFLELVSLYAVLYFIQKPKRTMWLIISAVFAGLAYNSYQPGRIFFIVPVLALMLHKETRIFRNFALFGGVFALLIAPLTWYLSQNQDIRIQQQLYLKDGSRTAMDKVMFFFDNVWRNTKLFFVEGDASGRHNYPFRAALNPIIAFISFTGLVQVLKGIKQKTHLLFLVYFGLAMGPTLLTYPHENPNMLRTVTVLPAIVYFVGLGIQALHEFVQKFDKKRVLGATFGTLMVILLLISSALELRTYFVFQREVFKESFEVKDNFGGVYFFMKKEGIDINKYRLNEKQVEKFNSVPGPEQIYRNK